ncbi:MAG: hypothetical protein KDD58_07325 [Bdellovibrionales bacterium]|nr:hypothetical protein [Bdellovibrionales bacterium]
MSKILNIFTLLSLTLIVSTYNACSDLSTKNNAEESLKLSDDNNSGTVVGNPISAKGVYFSKYSAINNNNETLARLCIDKIRFLEGQSGPETQEFSVGEVELIPEGSKLIDVKLKEGKYTKIEIIIKPKCGSKETVIVKNGSGEFVSEEDLELKFNGNFKVQDETVISLEIQKLMTELGKITNYEIIDEVFRKFIGTISVE